MSDLVCFASEVTLECNPLFNSRTQLALSAPVAMLVFVTTSGLHVTAVTVWEGLQP